MSMKVNCRIIKEETSNCVQDSEDLKVTFKVEPEGERV